MGKSKTLIQHNLLRKHCISLSLTNLVAFALLLFTDSSTGIDAREEIDIYYDEI